MKQSKKYDTVYQNYFFADEGNLQEFSNFRELSTCRNINQHVYRNSDNFYRNNQKNIIKLSKMYENSDNESTKFKESFEIYHKIDNFVINEDVFDRNFSGQILDRELNILNENAHTVEDYSLAGYYFANNPVHDNCIEFWRNSTIESVG